MKTLKYIGTHQRKGMIVEVNDKDVKRLLVSGNWSDVEDTGIPKEEISVIIKKEVVEDVIRN